MLWLHVPKYRFTGRLPDIYVASYRSLTIQVSNIRETKIFTNQSKNFLLNCNKRAHIIS